MADEISITVRPAQALRPFSNETPASSPGHPPKPRRHSYQASPRPSPNAQNPFKVESPRTEGQKETVDGLGLSSPQARDALVQAVLDCVDDSARRQKLESTIWREKMSEPSRWLLLISAILLLMGYHLNPRQIHMIVEVAVLILNNLLNLWLAVTSSLRSQCEIAERVHASILSFLDDMEESESRGKGGQTVLSPSTSYVAVLRDGTWQRMPMNLLVEGDVIALISGDVAPGDAVALGLKDQLNASDVRIKRGDRVPSLRHSPLAPGTGIDIGRDPALIVSLCGDMRLYQMLETPVTKNILESLSPPKRPQPLIGKQMKAARWWLQRLGTLFMLIFLAATLLRVLLLKFRVDWGEELLAQPVHLALCFLMLPLPTALLIGEAISTAHLLVLLESLLDHQHHQGSESSRIGEAEEEESRDGISVDEYDEVDFEERQIAMSKTHHEISKRRLWRYFWTTLRFRTGPCSAAHGPGFAARRALDEIRRAGSSSPSRYPHPANHYGTCESSPSVVSPLAGPLPNSPQSGEGDRLLGERQADPEPERPLLPIPFQSSKLLERLGSITVLCCTDDDVVCEPDPAPEEVFILKDNQGASVVLDLHVDKESQTGVRLPGPFHLRSPPACGFFRPPPQLPTEEGDKIAKAMRMLSAHVRNLPSQEYLTHLAREIGFCAEDLRFFYPRQVLHRVSPTLAYAEHTEDTHAQGFEDSRLRANLRSHFSSTIVLDSRSEGFQMLSKGHPRIVAAHCSEFWDGRSICPISAEGRRSITEIYNQWRLEDFECVAFSYSPIPARYYKYLEGPRGEMLPPVYLVESDSNGLYADGPNSEANIRRSSSNPELTKEEQWPTFPRLAVVASTLSMSSEPDQRDHQDDLTDPFRRTRSLNLAKDHRTAYSPVRGRRSMGSADPELLSRNWLQELSKLQDNQIFLGMAASSAQPKIEVAQLYEDLRASGIRFVYFSPRNMRRSKPLVEKMGIETDWNCAISLRPLDGSGQPDPHRMTSNYSDWIVKARLPHGTAAIRKHLEEVDNVPLLVSLYTDSTQDDILEVLKIFQENHEVVCTVGSALRASNAPLFEQADVAIAMHGQPRTLHEVLFPQTASAPALSAADLALSAYLNTMACAITVDGGREGQPRLLPLITFIRFGRRLLYNYRQALLFGLAAQLAVGSIFTMAEVMPVPQSATISGISLLWLLWVVIPSLSLSFLSSPADKGAMARTPPKNQYLGEDNGRFMLYFLIRMGPTILLCLFLYSWVMAHSLSLTATDPEEKKLSCFQLVYKTDLYGKVPASPRLEAAMIRAEATMLMLLVLSLCSSSISFMYRAESVRVENPTRNKVWVATVVTVIILQFLYSLAWTSGTTFDGFEIGLFLYNQPLLAWVLILIWPGLLLALDEAVKKHDKALYDRYYRYLRMQFDTRLGMWSPR